MNQDVKYVQFNGAPVELINGNKYTNEKLAKMYPSYFVEVQEKRMDEVVPKPEPVEVLETVTVEIAEPVTETVEEVSEVIETTTEESNQEEPKKRGRKPKQEVLVDESSEVTIEVSEES